MRPGYTISVIAHALVLGWLLLSFSARPLEAPPADPIVADVITETEFSKITAGVTTAKQTPTPTPVVDKVAEQKDPAPKAPEMKVAKQEVLTTTAPPPAPPQPDPKPDPTPEVKPEPKPDVKPAPAKPEAQSPPAAAPPAPEEPDPVAEALAREQARKEKAEEAKKAEEARKREEAKKREDAKKREEARKREEAKKQQEVKQDRSRIEMALNDMRAPQRQAVAGTMVNPTPSLGTTTGTAPELSQNEQARLIAEIMRQLRGCWHPPAGLADAKTLVVWVDFSLNPDGSLAGPPVVKRSGNGPLWQAAADSAVRAVRECASPPVGPMRLPAAKYEFWKEVEASFDPKEMF